MKKLFLISFLLLSITLSGCTLQKGLSQEELFEKKKDCASYKDEIHQEILRKFSFEIGEFEKSELEIFYSPSRASCLYYLSFIRQVDGISPVHMIDYVYDYLSNTEVLKVYHQSASEQDKTNFQKELKKLKGE